MTNTVEYRATLDSSGVKAGADEAVEAIKRINGDSVSESLLAAVTQAEKLGPATASSAATATTSLDATGNAAKAVGAALQASGTQASEGLQRVTKASKESESAQRQVVSAGDQLLRQLREQISTSGKTADELLRMKAAQAGVAAEAAPLILQLQNQRAAQIAAAEAALQEESAQRAAAAEKQRDIAAADAFVRSLQDQAATHGKSATEIARYRAAQLGVKDAAEPYIASLEAANKANARGALSAAQHANAMRMLPMQITDVVTSVASGMPMWMVAIQQGGQVRDSFNGVGNALKGVASLVTPTTAVLGMLVGTGAAVALAYKQGSGEADGFRQALVMSGNTAGVTVSQMGDIAKAVGDVVGGQHAASQALTQLAGTGAIAGESLQEFTAVAMNLERYAGQPVKTTAEHLAKLGDEPVKASIKLNEQYHYLTDAVYQQIKALEDKGRKEEAAALAQKTYADAMAERAGTMKSNLGTLERAWESLGSMASKAWNAMLNVGRAATLGDIRAKVDETTRELNDLIATTGTTTEGGAYVDPGARARARKIAALQKELGDLNAQAAPLEAEEMKAQVQAEQRANEDAKLAARQRIDEMRKQVRTRAQIRADEIEQLGRDRKTLDLNQKQYDDLLAGINEKYKDPKKAGASGGIKVSDNELATMKAQLVAAQQYHEQLVTMGPAAQGLNTAERESLKISEELKLATDAKTIARLQEKQALADTLAAQLRTNKGLEDSYKAHQKVIDTNFQEAAALDERVKQQEAANAVYGKGQVAIAQMTLAELEHQRAEAEGSDNFDPKYIASLEAKIAVQKRWVAALSDADAKRFDEHADKLLANAQEMAAVYEDERRLSGLTGIERERIVAARQVELKYAKERAAVDRQDVSDAEKERRKARLAVSEQLETAAAVSKAQGDYNAKNAADIEKSLTDALLRGFENGKTIAENFADTVENMFNTMVLRPVISAFMAPVSGIINSAVQSGLNAVGLGGSGAGGAGNALGGGLTDWSTWGSKGSTWLMDKGMSFVTDGWNSTGSALMSLGKTVQSVDTWLKGIPGMSGGIGSAAGYLGSIVSLTQGKYGSAIGSAIGTWALPGIGTMVGGFLGGLLDDLFGDDDVPRFEAAAQYKDGKTAKGWTDTAEWSDAYYPLVDGIAGSIGSALDATAKLFGQTAGYQLWTAFSKDAEDKGTFGVLSISGPDGKNLVDWSQYDKSWGGRWFADGDAGQKEFLTAIAQDVKTAFTSIDMPGWANQLMQAAEGLDGINAALQQIGAIKTVFDAWAASMEMFAGISGELQTQLLQESGGMDALAANVNAFNQGYFTEDERVAALDRQLRGSLTDLDVNIDPSQGEKAKEAFRKAVNDAMEAGNGELVAKLLKLADVFRVVADHAEKAADESKKQAEEAKKALQAATDASFRALQNAIDAERTAAQARLDVVQERISAERALMDTLHSHIEELRGNVDSTRAMAAAQGNRLIDQALTTYRRTGYLPDAAKIDEAATAAGGGITTDAYRSRLDYEAANMILANKLEELRDGAGKQLTNDELMLEQEKAQVDYLDQLLRSEKEALDIARGTYVGVRDVASAVRQFRDDLVKEKPGASGGSSGSSGGSSGGDGGAVWGPGSSSSSDAVTGYQRSVVYTGGEFFQGVSAADTARLDKLADLASQFHGTGNVTGLLTTARDAGYSLSDLQASLSTMPEFKGATYTDWLHAAQNAGIPAFAEGINLVPYDMRADLHAGETVVPAKFNPFNPNASTPWGVADNSLVVQAVNALASLVYDLGREQLLMLKSMESMARKADAIGVLQRPATA